MNPPAPVQMERAKINIRIQKEVWNSYKPQAHAHTTGSTANTKASLKRDTNVVKGDMGSNKKHRLGGPGNGVAHPHARTKNCNVKLSTFQYGGQARATKGVLKNGITLETPCLQPTCTSCWMWHPHLMGGQDVVDEHDRPMQKDQD
jgi:hypothetical protein